jgi:hypothetical protein
MGGIFEERGHRLHHVREYFRTTHLIAQLTRKTRSKQNTSSKLNSILVPVLALLMVCHALCNWINPRVKRPRLACSISQKLRDQLLNIERLTLRVSG